MRLWTLWCALLLTVSARAADPCPSVLILDPTPKTASFSLGGDDEMVVDHGDVVVNSANRPCLYVFNSVLTLKDGALKLAGGIQTLGKAEVSPKPVQGEPVADPFAQVKFPQAEGTRSSRQLFIRGGMKTTLKPGVYTGGVNLGNDADVELQPGTYYIMDGDFGVNKAKLRGTGVTLVVTGNKPGKLILGTDCDVELAAPTEGELNGLVLVVGGSDQAANVNGAKQVKLTGTFYAPRAKVAIFFNSAVVVDRLVCGQLSLGTGAKLQVTGAP